MVVILKQPGESMFELPSKDLSKLEMQTLNSWCIRLVYSSTCCGIKADLLNVDLGITEVKGDE